MPCSTPLHTASWVDRHRSAGTCQFIDITPRDISTTHTWLYFTALLLLPTAAFLCPLLHTSAHCCIPLPTTAYLCPLLHTSAHYCIPLPTAAAYLCLQWTNEFLVDQGPAVPQSFNMSAILREAQCIEQSQPLPSTTSMATPTSSISIEQGLKFSGVRAEINFILFCRQQYEGVGGAVCLSASCAW